MIYYSILQSTPDSITIEVDYRGATYKGTLSRSLTEVESLRKEVEHLKSMLDLATKPSDNISQTPPGDIS